MAHLDNATTPDSTLVSAIRGGIDAARAGDKKRAHALFRYVVEREPSNEVAWLWYANTAENPRDTVHGIRAALRLNPSNANAVESLPPALVRAGVAAARGGDRHGAAELLTEATKRDPNNETAWLWRAGVTDDPAEAIGYLERVLKINPANEHAKQGVVRLKAKIVPPEAGACPFCHHRPRDEHDTVADTCPRCGAVKVLHHPERFGEPVPNLDTALVEAAARRLKMAWSTAPTAATAHALGLAYLNLGYTEQSLAVLRTAVSAQGASPDWRDELANLVRYLSDAGACEKVPSGRFRAPKPRVMVVDDSPTVRKLVSSILVQAGYQVLEAGAAEEAAEKVSRSGPPKLFILDINMPGTDGFGLCKMLRADRDTAAVPVVFLTGKTGMLSKLHGRWAGAADYLTKPFEPEKLLATVTRLVPLAARKS